jgi:hypothetical protein
MRSLNMQEIFLSEEDRDKFFMWEPLTSSRHISRSTFTSQLGYQTQLRTLTLAWAIPFFSCESEQSCLQTTRLGLREAIL